MKKKTQNTDIDTSGKMEDATRLNLFTVNGSNRATSEPVENQSDEKKEIFIENSLRSHAR